MRNYKKYLAATLAAAMVLGNSAVAFAASPSTPSSPSDVVLTGTPSEGQTLTGTITGNAGMEGNVTTDVFSVVVPAFAVDPGDIPADVANPRDDLESGRGVFDFILDPQKLITKTDGAKYATGSSPNEVTLDFEENATMFFEQNDGKFRSESEAITVTNRSTMDVTISLEATFASTDGIALVTDETFKNISTPSEPSVYMALVTGTNTKTPIDPTTKKATVKSTMTKAPADAYEVNLDESGNYVYELANEDAKFSTYTYKLKGASNPNADWSGVANVDNTNVTVVWTVKIPENLAPSIATTTYQVPASGPLEVTVDLGEGDKAATNISKITYKSASDAEKTLTAGTDYEFADGKLKFKGSYLSGILTNDAITSRVHTITFNDTSKTAIDVTLNK